MSPENEETPTVNEEELDAQAQPNPYTEGVVQENFKDEEETA